MLGAVPPIAFIFIFLLGLMMILALSVSPNINSSLPDRKSDAISQKQAREKSQRKYISVLNHFPRKIEIGVVVDTASQLQKYIPLTSIRSSSTGRISILELEKYIFKDNIPKIRVFLSTDNQTHHLSDYHLSDSHNISELHVGMVTGMWSGFSETNHSPGGNAVQGTKWTKIHNLTNIPLLFNDEIVIPANSHTIFSGRDHMGVRLGTVLKNNDDIFPDYIIKKPITDLYYGVVSNHHVGDFGGFQMGEDFPNIATGKDGHWVMYPLEEGVYGSAHPSIDPFYLPREDSSCKYDDLDEWGRKK